MTRKLLTAALFGALALPASAQAQLGFGLAAGPSFPMGDFGDIAKSGSQLSGLLNVSIPLAPVGFRFEGSFGQYDYKNPLGSAGARVRMLSGTANAMLSTPGLIGPYVIGGIGYYRSTAECTGCVTESSKVGYNGGGGFRIGLLGFSAFAEARYHYLPGRSDPTTGGRNTGTQFAPLSIGITF